MDCSEVSKIVTELNTIVERARKETPADPKTDFDARKIGRKILEGQRLYDENSEILNGGELHGESRISLQQETETLRLALTDAKDILDKLGQTDSESERFRFKLTALKQRMRPLRHARSSSQKPDSTHKDSEGSRLSRTISYINSFLSVNGTSAGTTPSRYSRLGI